MGDDDDFTDPFEAAQEGGAGEGGAEEGVEERPGVDFRGGYKEQQHALGVERERARTAEERLSAEVHKILDEPAYNQLSRDQKDDIEAAITPMSNLRLYNLNALVLARTWFLKHPRESKNISPKEFKAFTTTYEDANVSPVDLLRYIRMLGK